MSGKGHRTDRPGNEGLSQEEIARILGCSRAYVSQVERRALAKLRRAIRLSGERGAFPALAEVLAEGFET